MPTPVVSVAGTAAIVEGSGGTSYASYTVSLSSTATSAVTVGYATISSTATADSDFAYTAGTLTIAAGSSFGVVQVPVYGDATSETDESFEFRLLWAGNGRLARSRSVYTTITSDDTPPTASLTGVASVAEGDSATATAVYTVSLSAAATSDVELVYTTSSGSATAGTDYGTTSGTLTIAAGGTLGLIEVPIYGDTTYESGETFALSLSSATNATVSSSQKSVTTTITNDDAAPPTASLTGTTSIVEGNSGTSSASYTVSLSGVSANDVTVAYSTVYATATGGDDYGATSGTLTIAAGSTQGLIEVPVYGDTTYESNETFALSLSSASNATLSSSQKSVITTITNDDVAPPTASLTGTTSIVEGDSGTAYASYTVSLSGVSASDVTVVYSTVYGTAIGGDDYGATSGTLTIVAGTTQGVILVPVYGDTTYENSETFALSLSSASNATLSNSQKSVTTTITNDEAPTLTLTGTTSISEGTSGTKYATYTVNLSGAATSPVVVVYATSDGTAVSGSDYVGTTGTLTIAAGSSTASISVAVNGDRDYEDSETYALSLVSATNATLSTSSNAVTTTITNDDRLVVSLTGASSVTEGNSGTSYATYTVSLSSASSSDVAVVYATSARSATANVDYGTASGTLILNAGSTWGTIEVPVYGDTTYEGNESFSLTLSSATNATLSGRKTIATTIYNDDGRSAMALLGSSSSMTAQFEAALQQFGLEGSSGSSAHAMVASDGGTELDTRKILTSTCPNWGLSS